jgi:hypothetical protein
MKKQSQKESNSWMFEEEKKISKKRHKAFRDNRKAKRNVWESN